jgi:ATP-binding cassette subfamily B multidrug efflux pump
MRRVTRQRHRARQRHHGRLSTAVTPGTAGQTGRIGNGRAVRDQRGALAVLCLLIPRRGTRAVQPARASAVSRFADLRPWLQNWPGALVDDGDARTARGGMVKPRRVKLSRRSRFLWELRPYFRQVAGLLVIGSIAGILMNVAIVLPAIFLGRAVNTVLAFHQGTTGASSVALAAVLFVVATAATQVPRIGKRYWLGLARVRFQANVRSDALRGVLGWPMERLAAMPVGGVMARVVGDVEVLGLGVGEVIVETWDTLLFSVALVVTMFVYDPGLALVALAPVPVALLVAKLAGRVVAARTTDARQADADLTAALHEQLGGFRLLRLSGRTGAAADRIRVLAHRQAAAELNAIRVDQGLAALYTTLLSAGAFFIIWLGGRSVAAGALSVGGLVAFLQLFARFTGRAPRIPQMANRVQAAGAAYARLRDLLATPVSITGEPRWSSFRSAHVAGFGPVSPEPDREGHAPAALSIRGVWFRYPGSTTQTLQDIDIDVPPGRLIAVTGPVGSGKSALGKLAAGIRQPDGGHVLLDGSPVAEIPPAHRARHIGYVGQEPDLFSGTVAENVLLQPRPYIPDRDDPVIDPALGMASLRADVSGMPAGVRTQIGEGGIRVSGGQRQRIAIARALAAGGMPSLLVLDDPFSAIDVQTEQAIIAALRARSAGRLAWAPTILLLSHRLAAFPYADEVVVLDHGTIEERGTHADLLEKGGLYARIYRAQADLDSSAASSRGAP